MTQRQGHGHVAASDRGGAGTPVRLEHIAVHDQRALTQPFKIHGGAQRAPDETPDLLSPPAQPVGLTAHAGVGGAREHGVFGSQPPHPTRGHPGWHLLLDADVAQHAGAAQFDQHRALGVLDVAQGQTDRAEFVGPAGVGTHRMIGHSTCDYTTRG